MSQTLHAEPGPIPFEIGRTALVIIDMQRDFLEPGGFGETLGNDVSLLQARGRALRRGARRGAGAGMLVIHTREGHRPDLSDAPPAKLARGAPSKRIGDPGPMGRILVRGEPGHDIVAGALPGRGRAGDRQARQGRLPPDRPRAGPEEQRASTRCSSAASPPRSACTPRSAKATTAAIAASRSPTPAPPTSRNSTASASR